MAEQHNQPQSDAMTPEMLLMQEIGKSLDVLGKRFGALEHKVDDIRDWQKKMEGRDYGQQIGDLRQEIQKVDGRYRIDLKAERERCEAKEAELEARIKHLETEARRNEGRATVYQAVAGAMPWLVPLGTIVVGFFIWLKTGGPKP